MNPVRRYFAASVLCGSILFLAGCEPEPAPPQPSGPDSTAPGFVQVKAQLEAPTPPNPRGDFDITTADVSRVGLASNLAIRITALAGDPESKIKNMALESNLTWQCSLGPNSEIIGIAENAPLAFPPITPPTSPITPMQINVVADPIAQIAQAGCPAAAGGKGPVNIRGFVRVVATNGASPGIEAKSKTFIFDYADIGSR